MSFPRDARHAKEGVDMTKQSDLLEAVSVADRVGELQFTVGQVCRMAGITKMQLDYWTERGSIPTQGKKQRLYDAAAVETVMLIKQARDLGIRCQRRDRGVEGLSGPPGGDGRAWPAPRRCLIALRSRNVDLQAVCRGAARGPGVGGHRDADRGARRRLGREAPCCGGDREAGHGGTARACALGGRGIATPVQADPGPVPARRTRSRCCSTSARTSAPTAPRSGGRS